jgi:hypothetical protein
VATEKRYNHYTVRFLNFQKKHHNLDILGMVQLQFLQQKKVPEAASKQQDRQEYRTTRPICIVKYST